MSFEKSIQETGTVTKSERPLKNGGDASKDKDNVFNFAEIAKACPDPGEVKHKNEGNKKFGDFIEEQHKRSKKPLCDTNGDDTTRTKDKIARISDKVDSTEADEAPANSKVLDPSLRSWVTNLAGIVSDHLNKFGVCVIDDFIGEDQGDPILDEVKEMQQHTEFKDGQLVASSDGSSQTIRSDKITWEDGVSPSYPALRYLLSRIDSLILVCSRAVPSSPLNKYTISGRSKAMVACYPGEGSHYVKHVDNPNKDGRCITAIYYLNKNWAKEDGGQLKIYTTCHEKMVAMVDPLFDRVIFFWSDIRNPHEVLPANRERLAITVWYYDENEKREYLRKKHEQQKDQDQETSARTKKII